MTQSIIEIQNLGGTLVVDSRLIAERLGIMHKSFMETVFKFQLRVEQRFGQLRFKTETVRNSVGAANEVKFVLLTKPQAEVYMTFSRNTEQVIECKLDLVQAFNEAEQIYQQPQLSSLPQTKADTCAPQAVLSQLNLVGEVLADLGIDSTIIGQLKLDAIAKQLPVTKDMIEAGKKLLSSQEPLESVGLTPSEIGFKLRPTAKPSEVNVILERLDLQYKHKRISAKSGKEKWDWQLTTQGLEYGHVYLTTGKQWSGGQIRWQTSVVRLIQCYLDDSQEQG